MLDMLNEQSIPVQQIGITGGQSMNINNYFKVDLTDLLDWYYKTLPEKMKN
jgi:hypothetical protein